MKTKNFDRKIRKKNKKKNKKNKTRTEEGAKRREKE